jgi:hypothetical protein
LEERDNGKLREVLERQLKAGLADVPESFAPEHIAVAYEPVWAIGTGRVAGSVEIVEAHGLVRSFLESFYPQKGREIRILYGGSLSVRYKDIELSAGLSGQNGNKILNRKRGQYIWTNDTNVDADLAVNRWHGEGTSNSYPSASGLRRGWNQKMSDFFVEDGSWFRIRDIQLAYYVRRKQTGGYRLPEAKITLTADRPLTLFRYNGFNPEVAYGIDTQTYPTPASYMVGLNLTF